MWPLGDAARRGRSFTGPAEALAFGSLARQGVPIRLAGEDARRGQKVVTHALVALVGMAVGKSRDGSSSTCRMATCT